MKLVVFNIDIQFSNTFVEMTFLSPVNYFDTFIKINWPYNCVSISGLYSSQLIYLSTLSQHHNVLITVIFIISFEIRYCESSNFVFVFQDYFSYSTSFSISYKICKQFCQFLEKTVCCAWLPHFRAVVWKVLPDQSLSDCGTHLIDFLSLMDYRYPLIVPKDMIV